MQHDDPWGVRESTGQEVFSGLEKCRIGHQSAPPPIPMSSIKVLIIPPLNQGQYPTQVQVPTRLPELRTFTFGVLIAHTSRHGVETEKRTSRPEWPAREDAGRPVLGNKGMGEFYVGNLH